MAPEKIDSLADDVKPLVLELLRQISGLTARVNELCEGLFGLAISQGAISSFANRTG
jgi:hypothetical protein